MKNLLNDVIARYDAFFETVENGQEGWFLGLLARLVFGSVLLLFFWQSALTKIGDSLFEPSAGAYAQILPKTLEAADYDTDQLSALHTVIVLGGTYAEFILPLLVLIGLFTRLSSLGMIGLITVMSLVDIFGHDLDDQSIGGLFDRFQDGIIADQRLLWVFPLVYLIMKGAGALSVDAVLSRNR